MHNSTLINIPKSVNWGGRALNLLAALSLVAALLLPVASAPASDARAQPLLLQMVAERPDDMVRVIVQKVAQGTGVEELVAALGGTVSKDLHIINAFAAEMKAKDALQLARAGGVRWVSLDAPVQQMEATAQFTTWATEFGTSVGIQFNNATAMVDSALGPNGTFGSGSEDSKGAFTGFAAEVTPGYAISKVEVVLHAYAPGKLGAGDDPKLRVYVAGVAGKEITLNHHAFDPYIGVAKAGTIYVDMTATRTWRWSDFDNGLELVINQSRLDDDSRIYYDAVGLRVTSAPGNDTTGDTGGETTPDTALSTTELVNVYNQVIGASSLWNDPYRLRGKGIGVAVVDSGIFKTKDLSKRKRASVNFNAAYHDSADRYGHGTFVAGIIAGSGSQSSGKYIGVAPKADIINFP